MFLFSILYKGKNVGPLYSVYLTQILNTTPSKWNTHLRWLSEKRHLSQSALEKMTMNEDEKSSIKTWEADSDTSL